jgi:hypothetical protein
MELTLAQAERFVATAPRAKWNGWDIEIYRPDPNSCIRSQGSFYNNQWCLKTTITPNTEGKYVITKGNEANASRPWN